MKSKSNLLMTVLFCVISYSAFASDAIWTGLGSDDRWTNPDNWQGGILPTSDDDIASSGELNPQHSITIDGVARANNFNVNEYGHLTSVFQNIMVKSGADFVLNNEFIDQYYGPGPGGGAYTQTGGNQVVNGNFWYLTRYGTFIMQGGSITVGGSYIMPDQGEAYFSGGVTTIGTMLIGPSNSDLSIGANAKFIICDELVLHGNSADYPRSWTFDSPIYIRGADVIGSGDWRSCDVLDGIRQIKLVFDGGLDDISLYEVAGTDMGAVLEGLVNNYAIDFLQLGGDDNGYVKLVKAGTSSDRDALYVDTLVLNSGSILDLNSCHLYCNEFIDYGGTFLNGSPIVVPEPATLLLLCIGGLAVLQKRRSINKQN